MWLCAQSEAPLVTDTAASATDTVARADSGMIEVAKVGSVVIEAPIDTVQVRLPWKPIPQRAVWMATLCPGLGQIYNRSYWKLPIVFGGLMGCVYAWIWNQGKYSKYRQAYKDLYYDNQNGCVDTEDPNKSYNKALPDGYAIERMGGVSRCITTYNNWQSTYHRYRDISIVCTIVVYGLSIIDAYVDAQLFDFDVSPDLSLHAQPGLYVDPYNHKSAELQVALTLK